MEDEEKNTVKKEKENRKIKILSILEKKKVKEKILKILSILKKKSKGKNIIKKIYKTILQK